jgi:hypothetical protein
VQIEEHDVDAAVIESSLGLADRPGLDDGISLELQVDSAKEPQGRIVVDDKHCRGVAAHRPSVPPFLESVDFLDFSQSTVTDSQECAFIDLKVGRRSEAEQADMVQQRLAAQLPQPTPSFRRRAWLEFQRALDPLAPPKPLRRVQP